MLLKKAAMAIQKNRFDKAIIRLHHALSVPVLKLPAFYWLSLIYRYLDRYDEEKNIVNQALVHFPGWDYMVERQNWHNLPLFDRLVPRPPLHLERDPQFTPKQETLEQLCFVTAGGSDQPYWNLLIELLESIKATRFYKDIPICVLDCGLTEEHKHFLYHHFKVHKIKDPGWDIEVPEINDVRGRGFHNGLKGLMARSFIPKHFPGFRYYFWIENDTWVHNEIALDKHVKLAEQNGVAIPLHISEDNYDLLFELFPDALRDEDKKFLKDKKAVIAGTFCIDEKRTHLFEHWTNLQKEIVLKKKKYIYYTDEGSLGVSCHQYGLKDYISRADHFAPHLTGMPILYNHHLYYPTSFEPIGIIHLTGWNQLKNLTLFPFMIKNKALNNVELKTNINLFYQFIKYPKTKVSNLNFLHYRTWPWVDKEQIIQTLNQEASNVLRN